MDILTITAGTYTLPESFDNPNVDRRVKNDWTRLETIEAGRYVATVYDYDPPSRDSKYHARVIEICRGPTGYRHTSASLKIETETGEVLCVGRTNPLTDMLIERLVPDESIEGLLAYARRKDYIDTEDIFNFLRASGVITDALIRTAVHGIRRAQDEENKAYREQQKREDAERERDKLKEDLDAQFVEGTGLKVG